MAAKVKQSTPNVRVSRTKVKRKGIHAKTKQSKNKNSINYKKPYIGQG